MFGVDWYFLFVVFFVCGNEAVKAVVAATAKEFDGAHAVCGDEAIDVAKWQERKFNRESYLFRPYWICSCRNLFCHRL